MSEGRSYRLRYAPSLPVLGLDIPLELRLEKYAANDIHAVEYSCAGRPGCGLVLNPLDEVETLRKTLDQFDMEMGVFVANPGAFRDAGLCDETQHQKFLTELRTAIAYHQVIDNRFCTILAGPEVSDVSRERQRRNVIQVLRDAAEILEGTFLTLALEAINTVERPDSFLVRSDEVADIVREVKSSHIRILFDVFHEHLAREDLVAQIHKHHDLIGYYQVADVPTRQEPGTGEIDWKSISKAIVETGYQGLVGMEHELSLAGEAGLEQCLEAYRKAESW